MARKGPRTSSSTCCGGHCAGLASSPAPAPGPATTRRSCPRWSPRRSSTAASALASAFSAHPYRLALLGTDATLGALTPDTLRAFYDRAYGAGQATQVVVGDFDARAVRARVGELFGAWRQATAPAARPSEPAQDQPPVVVSTADGAAPDLALAGKTPGL